MNLIPGLSLRASEHAEIDGIDDAEIGEFAVSSLLSFVLPSPQTQPLIFIFF